VSVTSLPDWVCQDEPLWFIQTSLL
jgi:hypothetical protein